MANVNLDPAYLEGQVRQSAQKAGRSLSDADVKQWVGYASTPTEYSDHQWRVGWNPYWEARMTPGHAASADPSLAGSEGIVAPPPGASRMSAPAQSAAPAAQYQQALQRLLSQQMQPAQTPPAATIPNLASMLKLFAPKTPNTPRASGASTPSSAVSLVDQIAADAIRRALGGV